MSAKTVKRMLVYGVIIGLVIFSLTAMYFYKKADVDDAANYTGATLVMETLADYEC